MKRRVLKKRHGERARYRAARRVFLFVRGFAGIAQSVREQAGEMFWEQYPERRRPLRKKPAYGFDRLVKSWFGWNVRPEKRHEARR